MRPLPSFPAPRVRAPLARTPLELVYERQESTRGFVTLADADGDVIRFSGEVDAVDLWVETFGAIVTLTNRDDTETDTITLRVGEKYAARFRCSVVRARNAVGGSNATVQAVGKWARQAERFGASGRDAEGYVPPVTPSEPDEAR